MIIPFEPEPIEKLKLRFPNALKKEWNQNTIPFLDKIRPGQDRTYIFDFQNGLRLIISKDNLKELGGLHIHISASGNNKDVFKNINSIEYLTSYIETHYLLLGGKGNLEWVGFSKGKVPHWKIKIGNKNEKN